VKARWLVGAGLLATALFAGVFVAARHSSVPLQEAQLRRQELARAVEARKAQLGEVESLKRLVEQSRPKAKAWWIPGERLARRLRAEAGELSVTQRRNRASGVFEMEVLSTGGVDRLRALLTALRKEPGIQIDELTIAPGQVGVRARTPDVLKHVEQKRETIPLVPPQLPADWTTLDLFGSKTREVRAECALLEQQLEALERELGDARDARYLQDELAERQAVMEAVRALAPVGFLPEDPARLFGDPPMFIDAQAVFRDGTIVLEGKLLPNSTVEQGAEALKPAFEVEIAPGPRYALRRRPP